MSAPGLTYHELRALRPCFDSLSRVAKLMGGAHKWNGRKITAAEARAAGATFNDIAWAASATALADHDVERRLRLWMADCAAHVLHIYERDSAGDRPRNSIIAVRAYARGKIGAGAIDAAARTARTARATWAAAEAAAGFGAAAAAMAAAWAASWAVFMGAVAGAAGAARDAAGFYAGAWDAEREWQFDRLIARLGDEEPDDYPLPERASAPKAAWGDR